MVNISWWICQVIKWNAVNNCNKQWMQYMEWNDPGKKWICIKNDIKVHYILTLQILLFAFISLLPNKVGKRSGTRATTNIVNSYQKCHQFFSGDLYSGNNFLSLWKAIKGRVDETCLLGLCRAVILTKKQKTLFLSKISSNTIFYSTLKLLKYYTYHLQPTITNQKIFS